MPATLKILPAAIAIALLSVAATAQAPSSGPTGREPGAMQRADREDMRLVLQKLQALGGRPVSTLSVDQARTQPTPADAVAAVLRDQGKDPAAIKAAMNVGKRDLTYPTAGGNQTIRIYTPSGTTGPLPVIVYYHGGGWVIADIDTYESSAIALARKANAIVASVEYRHAPEHKFPAAHDDAFNAYRWVLENAASFGGDPARIAVAGESAGGNLAINTAIRARDLNLRLPLHMVLVYPVAGTDTRTPSYRRNAEAIPLGRADMLWFLDLVLARPEDKDSPLLNLYSKANLRGLPPATIITAEIDPLESDGKLLADRLKSVGAQVTMHGESGVTHEFFGMDTVLDDARRAQDVAARNLRHAFGMAAIATGRPRN